MDIKKNKWLIGLIVILVVWELFTISNIKTQNENLERQINNLNDNMYNKLNSINDSVYDIKREISEELEKQTSIISSYSDDVSFMNSMLNIDLSFIPKEYKDDENVEVVFSSEKETKTFPAINQDGIFMVNAKLMPSEKINATIRFISGDTTRQEKLPEIDALDELAFEYDAYLLADRHFFEDDTTESENLEASNTIVVSLLPFYSKGRVKQPYEDLEYAKLILTNRANSKKALEVDLEKTTEAKFLQDFKYDDDISVLLANISEIKDVEGSFRVECELLTKEGLLYIFEIGEVNNYKSVNGNKANSNISIYSMGQVYPEF